MRRRAETTANAPEGCRATFADDERGAGGPAIHIEIGGCDTPAPNALVSFA